MIHKIGRLLRFEAPDGFNSRVALAVTNWDSEGEVSPDENMEYKKVITRTGVVEIFEKGKELTSFALVRSKNVSSEIKQIPEANVAACAYYIDLTVERDKTISVYYNGIERQGELLYFRANHEYKDFGDYVVFKDLRKDIELVISKKDIKILSVYSGKKPLTEEEKRRILNLM